MTSIERMQAALAREPVDTLPIAISPWGATVQRWINEGHIKQGEDVCRALRAGPAVGRVAQ